MAIYRWNLKEIDALMAQHGFVTQQAVNEAAGLSRLTMYNISRAQALTRLDLPTFDALAALFKLKGADRWRLLIVEE